MSVVEDGPRLEGETAAGLHRLSRTQLPSSARAIVRIKSARVVRQAHASAMQRRKEEQHLKREQEEAAKRAKSVRKSTVSTRYNEKVDEAWTVNTLEELKGAFYDEHDGILDTDQFVESLIPYSKSSSADHYLRNLFDKIDGSSLGAITWDEFATYMLLEYQKKADAYIRSKKITPDLPVTDAQLPVRGAASNIRSFGNQALLLQDRGSLAFYSANMTLVRKVQLPLASGPSSKNTWATDVAVIDRLSLVAVSSGEREIWFFNSKTMEPDFVIAQMDDTPLRLATTYNKDEHCTTLLVGDNQGCILAISLPDDCTSSQRFRESLSRRKLYNEIFRIKMDVLKTPQKVFGNISYVRWKVHTDWISSLMYCDSLRLIISSCNDEDTALVVGDILRPALDQPRSYNIAKNGPSAQYFHRGPATQRKNSTQTVFKVKKGVRNVAFVEKGALIVTGGMDRTIWLWNPYVSYRAAGALRGHTAPIHHICTHPTEAIVYSIATDAEVRIWDAIDHTCIITISHRRHKISGEATGIFYFQKAHALMFPCEQMSFLKLSSKTGTNSEVRTHDSEVVSCLFNPRFQHLVTGSSDGTIKVFTPDGTKAFEFSISDDELLDASNALTAMIFDVTNRRLITGQVNGKILAWNYGNGQLLREFNKGSSKEVTCLAYLQHGMLKRIVSSGWDRRLYLFKDAPESDLSVAPVRPLATRTKIAYHDDDVLAMCFCPPNTLVTSSYSGEIFAWNLTSLAVTAKIRPPPRQMGRRMSVSKINSMLSTNTISTMVWLAQRPSSHAGVGTLICGGCDGLVYFFSLMRTGTLIDKFCCATSDKVTISKLATPQNEHFLVVATSTGWVEVYDIRNYATGDWQYEDSAESDTLFSAYQEAGTVSGSFLHKEVDEQAANSVEHDEATTVLAGKAATNPREQNENTEQGGRQGSSSKSGESRVTRTSIVVDSSASSASEDEGEDKEHAGANDVFRASSAAKSKGVRESQRIFTQIRQRRRSSSMGQRVKRMDAKNHGSYRRNSEELGGFGEGSDPPPLVARWRAHLDSISTLVVIEDIEVCQHNKWVVVTGSKDKRARMWSLHGQFIGTYGQAESWDMASEETWQFPARPAEIVLFEQAEKRRQEERAAYDEEMRGLGLYDDDGDGYDGFDEQIFGAADEFGGDYADDGHDDHQRDGSGDKGRRGSFRRGRGHGDRDGREAGVEGDHPVPESRASKSVRESRIQMGRMTDGSEGVVDAVAHLRQMYKGGRQHPQSTAEEEDHGDGRAPPRPKSHLNRPRTGGRRQGRVGTQAAEGNGGTERRGGVTVTVTPSSTDHGGDRTKRNSRTLRSSSMSESRAGSGRREQQHPRSQNSASRSAQLQHRHHHRQQQPQRRRRSSRAQDESEDALGRLSFVDSDPDDDNDGDDDGDDEYDDDDNFSSLRPQTPYKERQLRIAQQQQQEQHRHRLPSQKLQALHTSAVSQSSLMSDMDASVATRDSSRQASARRKSTLKSGFSDRRASLSADRKLMQERKTSAINDEITRVLGSADAMEKLSADEALSLRRKSASIVASRKKLFNLTPNSNSTSCLKKNLGETTDGARRARRSSTARDMTRVDSAPVFRRMSERQSGNWGRHMQHIPNRPMSDKHVYLSLPYHDLESVQHSAKELDTSALS